MTISTRKSLRSRAVGIAATTLGAVALTVAATAPAHAAAVDVGPGIEIQITQSPVTASICTLAFGATTPANEPVAVTAGHCGSVGQQVYTKSGVNIGVVEKSAAPPTGPGGVVLDTTAPDWATIKLNSNANLVAGLGNVHPTSLGTPQVGDQVCSQGRTTGWRCGTIAEVNGYWINTTIEREQGDSGGPLIRTSDGAALGILSSGVGGGGGGIFGSLGGDTPQGSSRYFSLSTALRLAGDYRLATGSTTPDSDRPASKTPAPERKTLEPLPSVG